MSEVGTGERRARVYSKYRKRGSSRFLNAVWAQHDGICQRCGCPTQTISRVQAWGGWEIFRPFGVVVSPGGFAFGIATVQHVVPLCRGGTDTRDNVTLYCERCNLDDNAEMWNDTPAVVRPGHDAVGALEGGFAYRKVPASERVLRRLQWQRWADDGGREVDPE